MLSAESLSVLVGFHGVGDEIVVLVYVVDDLPRPRMSVVLMHVTISGCSGSGASMVLSGLNTGYLDRASTM